jgi:hypothetical protein
MAKHAEQDFRILTPAGILGYGIKEADFLRGIEAGADAVVVDAGSTDPGPYLLGLAKTIVARGALERDLRTILSACVPRKVPLLIGSAGGAGIAAHVDETIALVGQIAESLGRKLKVAAIYSDIDRELVSRRLQEGRIGPCASAPQPSQQDIDESVHIVGQMGEEPFIDILREHPDVDVIVAGRAYDPAPFAALCARRNIDPGTYWHMGKIMECGAVCAEPKGGVILATIRPGSFDLEPMDPNARCTITSVAAHSLYEKTRPDLLSGPGGVLDLRHSKYEQIDCRRVRVSGSEFHRSDNYQVKLEGAALIGYRTIFVGGIRDPILIEQLDKFLDRVQKKVAATYPALNEGKAKVVFHAYGKNGVMGETEPLKDIVPHEVGLLCEVTAATQDIANAICSAVRIGVLHLDYPGQMATAGNLAIPLNPPENPIGPVCRFSLYHLMEVESPQELFRSRLIEVGA